LKIDLNWFVGVVSLFHAIGLGGQGCYLVVLVFFVSNQKNILVMKGKSCFK